MEATIQRSNLVACPSPHQHHHQGKIFGKPIAKPATICPVFFVFVQGWFPPIIFDRKGGDKNNFIEEGSMNNNTLEKHSYLDLPKKGN